jgi:hypothetical protein
MTTHRQKLNLGAFSTKKQLEDRVDINDYICLATDKAENSGNKIFYRTLISTKADKVPTLLQTNNNLYETLYENRTRKPYFDCEMERTGLSHGECRELIDLFIDLTIKQMNHFFHIDLATEDFIILDSCRENKLSYHLVIQNKIYFANNNDHKVFILWLWEQYNSPQNEEDQQVIRRLTWDYIKKDTVVETRRIFDKLPYSAFQQFRAVNQSKKGGKYTLINLSDYSDVDTLVGLYTAEEIADRLLLNVESLTNQTKIQVKKRQTSTKTKTSQPVVIEDEFQREGLTLYEKLLEKDNKKLSQLPRYLQLLYLIPNHGQEWKFFISIGMAIKGAGGTVEDWKKWAGLSEKVVKNDPQFKGFSRFREEGAENTYGIPFLEKYATLANPELVDVVSELENYFRPNLKGIRYIRETCDFISEKGTVFEADIQAPEKLMILWAYMGKGKTTSCKLLIKPYKRVLFISPRIAFSRFLEKEFGAKNYIDGDIGANIQIISMESLHKLKSCDPYECIIVDECEPNLSIFTSETLRGKQIETYKLLVKLIEGCKKAVFATAFLTNKTVDFVRSLGGDAVVIHNVSKPTARLATEIDQEGFNHHIIQQLKQGKKVYCVFSTRTAQEKFHAELKGAAGENEQLKGIVDRTLIYSKMSDDKLFTDLKDIGRQWGNASLVTTTPSITVGNSYDKKDFDLVYIQGMPSCIVADIMQSHMRIRHLKCNPLYFSLPTSKQMAGMNLSCNAKFLILRQFDRFNEVSRANIVEMVSDLIDNSKIKEEYKAELRIIRTSFTTDYDQTPEHLRRLMMQSLYETTLSKQKYGKMFLKFLEVCNYSITEKYQSDGDAESIARLQGAAVFTQYKYEEIAVINREEAESIQRRIQMKRASGADKIELQKFYFERKIDRGLDITVKQSLFTTLVTSSFYEELFNNGYMEAAVSTERSFIRTFQDKNTGIEINNKKSEQLFLVRFVTRLLGLEHSMSRATVTMERLTSASEAICGLRSKIHKDFGLRDYSRGDKKNDMRTALDLVNKMFKAWTGSHLKKESEDLYCVIPLHDKPVATFYKLSGCSTPIQEEQDTPLTHGVCLIDCSTFDERIEIPVAQIVIEVCYAMPVATPLFVRAWEEKSYRGGNGQLRIRGLAKSCC